MTTNDIPTIDQFWIRLLSWYAWVHEGHSNAKRNLKVAEEHEGQEYNMNLYRRERDGKLFNHGRDGFVEAKEGTPNMYYGETAESAAEKGLEFIPTPHGQWKGNINGLLVLIDNTIMERASFSYRSEWAWTQLKNLDIPDPKPKSEADHLRHSLKHYQSGLDVVHELLRRREETETFIKTLVMEGDHYKESTGGSLERIAKHFDLLPAGEYLPDTGPISAFLTRYIRYQKTGELISVAY